MNSKLTLKPRTGAGSLSLWLALALPGAGCSADTQSPVVPEPPVDRPTVDLPVLGPGEVTDRFTSELWVRGDWAYTGTWGTSTAGRATGNVLNIWNVAGAEPVLSGAIEIGPDSVSTLGDVQVSDDGSILVVATEQAPFGSIRIFDVTDPADPQPIGRFDESGVRAGVHTAAVERVNGTLYGFLSVTSGAPKLVILDLTEPAAPREVFTQPMGVPFVHDVFVRDGMLFTALWNGGVGIWDLGGMGDGSPESPRLVSTAPTVNGRAHNVWWGGFDSDPIDSRYIFVGEEGPAQLGVSASGDVHVVDISDIDNPREVAFFGVSGAGAHNFSVDEQAGVLYAAFYNGGVRGLDVRGNLADCGAADRDEQGRCDLGRSREVGRALHDQRVYIWGVQVQGSRLFASDWLNGLWTIDISPLQ